MSENSAIGWCDHTFNLVWGCSKKARGCRYCYALRWAEQNGHKGLWGKLSPRRVMSEAYYNQPYTWNRKAQKAGKRAIVFCGSMFDVGEDHPTVEVQLPRLFTTIEKTDWLIWLLLTKRPERLPHILPPHWLDNPPPNVWYGTSISKQDEVDTMVQALCQVPATGRFVSAEPLCGWVNLTDYLGKGGVGWLITGGESGGQEVQPLFPAWATSLQQQAERANIPFFFKQWGNYVPVDHCPTKAQWNAGAAVVLPRGGKINKTSNGEYDPATLDDYQFRYDGQYMVYHHKKPLGSAVLDGKVWEQFPAGFREPLPQTPVQEVDQWRLFD
jgi:protein gp37